MKKLSERKIKELERILYALEDAGVIEVTADSLWLREALEELDLSDLPEVIEA